MKKLKCFFGKHDKNVTIEVVPGWTGKIVSTTNLPWLLVKRSLCKNCNYFHSESITKGSEKEMMNAKVNFDIFDSPLAKVMREE